jgi:hypothetical protein
MDPNVIDRLILSRQFLNRMRSTGMAEPDRYSLAAQLISSHDAAELALSAVAQHCGKLPNRDKQYLMDYFEPLKELHPARDVVGRSFFSQLNRVRTDIKHLGIFPDPKQWVQVAERVSDYVAQWCQEYLAVSFEEIDQSMLIADEDVKRFFGAAKAATMEGNYEAVLINIGKALHLLFKSNPAVSGLRVGVPNAEYAIKLTGFGVHANDFLTLQQFMPKITETDDGQLTHKWEQEEFGHPGNWRQAAVAFCLNTFLDMALKLQGANWVPGVYHFGTLYEHKITALADSVELWKEERETDNSLSMFAAWADTGKRRRVPVKTLRHGESLRGTVSVHSRVPGPVDETSTPLIVTLAIRLHDRSMVYVLASDVSVLCVRKENDFVNEYFSELPDVEWQHS